MNRLRIGIDFDNTLIYLDRVFHHEAIKRGWIPKRTPADKTAIRDTIRKRFGNDRWTMLQSIVYSRGLARAPFLPGAKACLRRLQKEGAELFIISHKTEKAASPENPADLRVPAYAWLKRRGFFDRRGFGLNRARNVFFEATRAAKLKRIASLGCTHFIDDLEEVFLERDFPGGVFGMHLGRSASVGAADKSVYSFGSWQAVDRFLAPGGRPPDRSVKRWLLRRRIIPAAIEIKGGGRNHQSYKITDCRGKAYFLKIYASKPEDAADRLMTEYAGLGFLGKKGFGGTARPLFYNRRLSCALYSFLPGAVPERSQIDKMTLDAALVFFKKLIRLSGVPGAGRFGPAREACFSIGEYLRNVESRYGRLRLVREAPVRRFLAGRAKDLMRRVRRYAEDRMRQQGISPDKILPKAERILSPSDVGFHNVLVSENPRRTYFFDFEYFGFDDPAKTLADFILQPDRPVPAEHVPYFIKKFSAMFGSAREELSERFAVIYPILWLKWIFIVLNVYRPGWQTPGAADPDYRKRQFQKAKRMARALEQALTAGKFVERPD